MKFKDISVGQFFVTALGNTCQKTGPAALTRLFNAAGEACVHAFYGRSPDELIAAALPPGTNF